MAKGGPSSLELEALAAVLHSGSNAAPQMHLPDAVSIDPMLDLTEEPCMLLAMRLAGVRSLTLGIELG